MSWNQRNPFGNGASNAQSCGSTGDGQAPGTNPFDDPEFRAYFAQNLTRRLRGGEDLVYPRPFGNFTPDPLRIAIEDFCEAISAQWQQQQMGAPSGNTFGQANSGANSNDFTNSGGASLRQAYASAPNANEPYGPFTSGTPRRRSQSLSPPRNTLPRAGSRNASANRRGTYDPFPQPTIQEEKADDETSSAMSWMTSGGTQRKGPQQQAKKTEGGGGSYNFTF